MISRDLREIKQGHYFAQVKDDNAKYDDGTRDMFPLAPFVVSGGRNTERFYFVHINDLSEKYKFNIRPEYFGDESAYTENFPMRISDILSKNADAKVFCVFDMDTVFHQGQFDKHEKFIKSLQTEIENGQVVICDSMPSFEFWLLLHFVDYKGLLKDYPEVSQVLAPYIKPYFKESSDKRLKKLLKKEKYLKDSSWVGKLLKEGRLEQAIDRAKICIERANREGKEHSYTNVFKIFEGIDAIKSSIEE